MTCDAVFILLVPASGFRVSHIGQAYLFELATLYTTVMSKELRDQILTLSQACFHLHICSATIMAKLHSIWGQSQCRDLKSLAGLPPVKKN